MADAGETDTTYTVALASPPHEPVTVAVTVEGDEDVTVLPRELLFSVGNWNDPQTVTVSAAHDDDAAGDMATVTHAATGGGYDETGSGAVTVTVTDDEVASTTVTLSVAPETVPEEGGVVELTVTAMLDLAPRLTETVVMLAATDDSPAKAGEDFLALTGVAVTIPANATQGSATVSFTPLKRRRRRGPERDGEAGRHGGRAHGAPGDADHHRQRRQGHPGAAGSGDAPRGGQCDLLGGARLPADGRSEVVVGQLETNRDVTVEPSELTFDASNWSTAQWVTVSAVHDADGEDDTARLRHLASGRTTPAGWMNRCSR